MILALLTFAVLASREICRADADVFVFVNPTEFLPIVSGGVVLLQGSIVNSGPDPAADIELGVVMPDFFNLNSATFSSGSYTVQTNGNTLVFSLGNQAAFSSVTYDISLAADSGASLGEFLVELLLELATADPNTNNNRGTATGRVNPPPGGFYNPNGQVSLMCPVGTFSGNYIEFESPDLNLGGPLPIFLERYYDSALFTDGVVQSALGHNWQHNWDITLSVAGTNATVAFRRGRTLTFQHDGTNWNQVFYTQIGFRLVDLGGEFLLGDPRSQLMYFFDGSGLLTRIEDGRGNTNSLSYTGGLLASVTDGLNRTLNFTYDASGLLTNVTDGVRSVSYTHTGTNLTSFTDVNGRITTYAYDPANTNNPGLMTARTLPEGNTPVTQVYDPSGRVIIQADAAGQTNTLAYATLMGTNTTTMTDAVGNTMTHVYLGTGELTQLTDEAGQTVSVGVDANGRRSQVRDRKGQSTILLYDAASGLPTRINHPANNDDVLAYSSRTVNGVELKDLSRITRPDGRQDNFTYDALGNLIAYTNRAGEVWTMGRNGRGQLLASTNPTAGIVSFTYDANARLASATDSEVGLTTFAYDGLNRLTSVTNADATMSSFEYDPLNRLVLSTDARGNTIRSEYDDNSRLTATTNALDQETRFEYDGLNRLTRVTDRLGNAATFGYDPRATPSSLLTATTNRNGFVTRYEYDARRRLTAVVDAGGKTNSFEYDAENLLLAARNALGETIRIKRDPMGYPTNFTDALGNEVGLLRDQMKRVTRVTDSLGRVANYTYEERGLLSSASREPDIDASYTYDGLGNLTQIIDPNNRFWRFTNSPMGRLVGMTDPIGRATSYTYDNRGRLKTAAYPDGATRTNTYDAVNNLTRVQYSDGTDLNFAYDALDRLTNAMGSDPIAFEYDAMDRVVNTRQVGLDFGAAYDADGRLTNVTYNSGQFTVTYTYDSRDRLIGVSDDLTDTSLTFTYDDAHRLTGVTRPNGVNGTYTYDARGLITRIQEGGATNIIDIQYTHDSAGQVTVADFVAAPIDPATAATEGTNNYFYDSASQITSAPGYAYGARGNQTQRAGTTIGWDDALRVHSVGAVTYTYNALNDLETRIESGNTNRYFYNYAIGLNPILAERDDNTGQFTRFYVWSPGGLLLYIINLPGNTVSFPLFDRVGSTLALTDGAGAVSDAYAYNAYGRVLSQFGTNPQPFRFNGRFCIRADGSLLHMRARWYDPVAARFLSKEPIWPVLARPGMLNPYQFASRNPVRNADPTGRDPKSLTTLGRFYAPIGYERVYDDEDDFLYVKAPNPDTFGDQFGDLPPWFDTSAPGFPNPEIEEVIDIGGPRQPSFKRWSGRPLWPKPREVSGEDSAPFTVMGALGGLQSTSGFPVGASGNTFLIEGVDADDNLFGTANPTFLEAAIADVQVLTSGIPAEYGRFSGGVVNAVTKSGGTELSGGKIEYLRSVFSNVLFKDPATDSQTGSPQTLAGNGTTTASDLINLSVQQDGPGGDFITVEGDIQ